MATSNSTPIYTTLTDVTAMPAHEVNLGSDEEARLLAEMMLGDRPNCSCAEIWDRARLVDKVQGNRSVEPQPRSIQVDWRDIAR